MSQAMEKPDINPLTFDGEIVHIDPVTTFLSHDEMPDTVAIGIIMRDIPAIFKTQLKAKDITSFKTKLDKCVRLAVHFQSLWSAKPTKTTRADFAKKFPEYNKYLNYLQQHLRSDECEPNIAAKRDVIRGMAFYEGPYRFHANETVHQIHAHVPEPEPEASYETRFTNYDGMPILASQLRRIRVPQTQDPMTRANGGGVAFGFDSHEEAFDMFCAALDSATPDQLKKEDLRMVSPSERRTAIGTLPTDAGRFFIELWCRHNSVDAKLSSGSSKIVACLTNATMKPQRLSEILANPVELRCPANLHALGRYLEFHMKVQKTIKQLLSASFGRDGFDLVCIDCFRPGCDHFSVFRKPAVGASNSAKCTKCRIAEFCLKCTRASHGGECDRLDEASEQLIRENTRACPRCLAHVEKDGGCNHMSCRCGAHFCWLCNQSYERNLINDHYVGRDAYGRCRGLLNPIAPHVGAAVGGGAVGGDGFIPFDDQPPIMVRANAGPPPRLVRGDGAVGAVGAGDAAVGAVGGGGLIPFDDPPPMMVRAYAGPLPMVVRGRFLSADRRDRLIARAIRAMNNDGPLLDRPEAETLLAILLDEAPVDLPLAQRENLIVMMLERVQ